MAPLGDVLEHFGNQMAIAREQWNGRSLVIMGMDNVGWVYTWQHNCDLDYFTKRMWFPCLAEIKATDWIKLPILFGIDRNEFNNTVMSYFRGYPTSTTWKELTFPATRSSDLCPKCLLNRKPPEDELCGDCLDWLEVLRHQMSISSSHIIRMSKPVTN